MKRLKINPTKLSKRTSKKALKIKDKAIVFIDWANVYNWKKSLKREVDPRRLFDYLREYRQIKEIRFYFGKDENSKSHGFLRKTKKIGYKVVTKAVKYILVAKVENQEVYRRKCDFDMEICIDVHQALDENIESFIFFTGDGDFEPLYKLLIRKRKQVIVVYMYGHLGREIFHLKKGIYKVSVETLERWYGKSLTK